MGGLTAMIFRNVSAFGVLALLAMTSSLAGQDGQDRPTRQQLMRQIEQRFMARATEDLGLDAEQAERLRSTVTHFAIERRRLEQRERDVKRGLNGQLRPGVAADPDSLVVLLDALTETRMSYLQSFKDELTEMTEYLDPVQRAQYVMLRERLLEQIRRAQAARRRQGGGVPGGAPDL
jgi:hypothetical protein